MTVNRTGIIYDPYPGYNIIKSECVGHVQKRVGARLRALKASYKGKLLVDKKNYWCRQND